MTSRFDTRKTWGAWPEISIYLFHKNPRLLPNSQVFKSLDLFYYFFAFDFLT